MRSDDFDECVGTINKSYCLFIKANLLLHANANNRRRPLVFISLQELEWVGLQMVLIEIALINNNYLLSEG